MFELNELTFEHGTIFADFLDAVLAIYVFEHLINDLLIDPQLDEVVTYVDEFFLVRLLIQELFDVVTLDDLVVG